MEELRKIIRCGIVRMQVSRITFSLPTIQWMAPAGSGSSSRTSNCSESETDLKVWNSRGDPSRSSSRIGCGSVQEPKQASLYQAMLEYSFIQETVWFPMPRLDEKRKPPVGSPPNDGLRTETDHCDEIDPWETTILDHQRVCSDGRF